jgi:hypothetical protein
MLASQAIHHQCQAPLGKKKIISNLRGIFFHFIINFYLVKPLLSINVTNESNN